MKQRMSVIACTAGVISLTLFLVACSDKGTDPPPPNTNPEGELYVLNQGDSSMYIYDSHTLQLLDTIRTGLAATPHHIEFDPQHEYAYIVGRTNPGQFTKFHLHDNAIETTVTTPASMLPTSMVTSGDGQTAYVCDFRTKALGGGRIHRLNLVTMTYIDSAYQSGFQTHDIKATVDRQILVAANYESDNVTIVYLAGDSVTFVDCEPGGNNPSINSEGPYGIAIDHKDSLVYIACRLSRKIRVMDLKARTIVDSISVPGTAVVDPYGPSLAAITDDDSRLYVTSQNDNLVHIINVSTRSVIKSIPTGATQPFGVTISDDQSRVYVACVNVSGLGHIYLIDPTKEAIVDSIVAGHKTYMCHHHAAHM